MDSMTGFNKKLIIGPSHQIYLTFITQLVWYSSLTAINIFLALYFLLYFYFRREKYYLNFSLTSLTIGLWIFGYHGYIFYLLDFKLAHVLTTHTCSVLTTIFFITFCHSFLKLSHNLVSKFLICLLSFLGLFTLIEFIITDQMAFYFDYLHKPFIFTGLTSLIYLTVITIQSVKKRINYSTYILAGLITLLVTYGISILVFIDIIRFYPPLSEGFFAMVIIFATALASRFSKVHTDLEKAHSDLLVLDKMKDDFLATTTHELRTPLHGIMGIAESMESGSLGDLNARQKENLQLIHASALRLNELVNSILDFSKLRAGKADLFIEEVSIGDLATSALSLLKPSADEKNLELRSEIGQLPAIKADRNRIYQIIFNLAGNAIKFTDAGSVVLRAEAAEGAVRVCVTDTGPGIVPEDLGRIWSPFTQAENPETRHTVGTGLGLAITRHLVELHGGRIWAESEPGKGSTFCFELPLEPPATGIARISPAARAAAPTAPMALSKEHLTFVTAANPEQARAAILAVDDDPVNLRVLENLCAEHSFKLITTAAGPAALDILRHTEIDLVLLDLMLPGMSGYEVCQRIREMEKGRYIPVIMVTALDQTGHMARGFRTGANDYVTKPFNRSELVMRIENQLAIKQMLDMEKTVVNGLRKEKDAISNMFQRSVDLKESALRMAEWEKIIREDLAIARAFQSKLMTAAGKVAGIETSVTYLPLMEIGGDVYDIFEPRGGVMRLFIADATGHGITASLNTVKILSEYASVKEVMDTPSAVIGYLNRRFLAERGHQQIVFACAVADIDLKSGTATIATAGLPAQYLLRDGRATAIEPMNPIVGLSDKIEIHEATLAFNMGDTLFLTTDGLHEMEEAQSRPAVPAERDILAERLIKAYTGNGVEDGSAEILKLFGGKKRIVSDDVTYIAVRRTG